MGCCISLGDLKKISSFDDDEGGRNLIDPFDSYGSLGDFTFRRVQFADGILHLIGES